MFGLYRRNCRREWIRILKRTVFSMDLPKRDLQFVSRGKNVKLLAGSPAEPRNS